MLPRVLQPPRLPFTIRALNRAGRLARGLGLPVLSLEESRLLAASRRRTGLSDFGDGHFRDGLRELLASLEQEARLSPLGRYIARSEMLMALENHQRLADWHARHPEIAREEIRRPLFVVGQGRTGTTILQELLAQDPGLRLAAAWELDRPFPPPEAASYDSDPRIAGVQKTIDRSESLIPDFRKMHRMGATLPQECVRITSNDFASMIFPTCYDVPSYACWLLEEADMAPVYANHRRMLQLLQWRCRRPRWALKSPGHLWSLPQLLAEYPDACLVQTHRDPLQILSSLTSLVTTLRGMSSDAVDPRSVARDWSGWLARSYDASVDAREQGLVAPERAVDVQFAEFVSDPIANVNRIYAAFDIEFTDEARSRMQAYLAANPSDKHGKHAHRFSDTGLDVGEEREKVKRYQEYFDVPSETTG
jgi:hypothetical protein